MSIGSIKDYTKFYKLIIPRFDLATWHDFIETNFRSIDALLYNTFAIAGFKGMWENSTTYDVGDVLFIGNDDTDWEGRLVKVLSNHTTPATGTFEDYYDSNQDKYDTEIDVGAAEEFAKLAKDWAIKTDGIIADGEYSSKYYAQQSSSYATNSSNSATSAETYKNNAKVWAEGTDEEVQSLGGTHSAKSWAQGINLSLSDLGETDINSPTAGQFLMYNDEGYWTNTDSTASIAWGGITGTLANQTDLKNALDGKADDSTVVHITGAETITGAKTFTNTSAFKSNILRSINIVRGTNPESTQYANLYMTDSTATSGDNTAFGCFRTMVESTGNVYSIMRAFKNTTAGTNSYADIKIAYPLSGDPYATAPTPTDTYANTSGTQIAVTGWTATNFVSLAGDNTITGRKNFVGGYNNVRLSCTTNDITGNNNYTDIAFFNNTGSTKNAYIRANNAGNLYLSATDAVTAPASDKADSILITVAKSKGQNGYFKLGNGLIVQWGKSATTDASAKITLPIAFTTTNYSIVANSSETTLGSASNRIHGGWAQVTARTTTNFTVYRCNYENSYWWNETKVPFTWIAIGY